jgi:hypothetical protein
LLQYGKADVIRMLVSPFFGSMAAAPGGGIERNTPSAGLIFAVIVERYRERIEMYKEEMADRYREVRMAVFKQHSL